MKTPIKYALTVALIALQAAALAIVLFASQARTSEVLSERFATHQARVAEDIAEEAIEFVSPAEDLVQWIISVDRDLGVEALELSLIAQLELNPQIEGAFIGDADGDFYYLSRTAEVQDGYRIKTIAVEETSRTTELRFVDARGIAVSQEFDPDDTYDPTTRPWYGEALATDGMIWTDPYIFFTSGAPGITVAASASNGRVVGVDIELDALSMLIAREALKEQSAVFLVDQSGTTLAASTPEEASAVTGLVPINELEQPLIRATFAALLEEDSAGNLVQVTFDQNGRRHQATFAAVKGLPWSIGVVADDELFLGDLRANQDRNLAWSLAIGLVAALVAIPLIFGFTKPLSRLHHQASTDPVTGLPNRRSLMAVGDQLLDDPSAEVVVVMMDIDHFKSPNDTYGHAVGDEVLKAISQRISGSLRDGDIVGRWGGDEFCMFLPETTLEAGFAITERLRQIVASDPIQTGAGPLDLTCSFGVAGRTLGANLEESVGAADLALLEAKDAGKNVVSAYGHALSTRS